MSRQQPSNHIAQGGTAYRCLKSQAGLFNPGQTYPHQSKPRFSPIVYPCHFNSTLCASNRAIPVQSKPRFSPTHLLTPVLGFPNLSKPDHSSSQHVSTFQVSPSHAFLSQLFNMAVHCTPIQTIAMLTYPVQSFSCHAFLPMFIRAAANHTVPRRAFSDHFMPRFSPNVYPCPNHADHSQAPRTMPFRSEPKHASLFTPDTP